MTSDLIDETRRELEETRELIDNKLCGMAASRLGELVEKLKKIDVQTPGLFQLAVDVGIQVGRLDATIDSLLEQARVI